MATTNKTTEDSKSFTITMPDVSDIPGQEHVHPPRMREMEDVTISSAGEEGEGLLDELNGGENNTDMDDATNVGTQERIALGNAGRIVNEETRDREGMALDSEDEDGDPLNESGNAADLGEDLDVPGAGEDDADESIGEEDEENNYYSNPD
ncbi:MAG: hypothetical protein EOO09_19940 [Chitinophagaceae bacterium]|nr:MAG: hypothetical protein EOO09_19940 [Chitinophagaceae bacterium]